MPPTSIMMIAGEASGDMHGAKLAQAIHARATDITLFGVGGSAMRAQGVDILVDAHTLSVVGITEVLNKLLTIYRAMTTVKRVLNQRRPDLLILRQNPTPSAGVDEQSDRKNRE